MAARRRSVRARVLRVARHSPYLTVAEIAAVVGCHRSTVGKHLNGCDGVVAVLPPAGPASGLRAAGSAACPPAVLGLLSRVSDIEIREMVAGNPSSPPEVLRRVAAGRGQSARWAAAGNPSSPRVALVRLAGDGDWRVRKAVAGNPNCPLGVLRRLRRGSDDDVRDAAVRNVARGPQHPSLLLFEDP